jgi:hypothetical protein
MQTINEIISHALVGSSGSPEPTVTPVLNGCVTDGFGETSNMQNIHKACAKCGAFKPLAAFGANRTRKDGHQSRCKFCEKSRNAKNRARVVADPVLHAARLEFSRAYNQKLKAEGLRKKRSPAQIAEEDRRTHAKHPERRRARNAVNNAITSGRLKRQTVCEDCGSTPEKIQKHHECYSKPLEVVWLCVPCHGKRHRIDVHSEIAVN